MEYDIDRVANECQELNDKIRPLLVDKSGPVLMTSLSYIVAEAMFNVSKPEDWETNVDHFAKAILEYLNGIKVFVEATANDAS